MYSQSSNGGLLVRPAEVRRGGWVGLGGSDAGGTAVLDVRLPSTVPGVPGTRSTPPGCQGAHLTQPAQASQLPRAAPCRSIASAA